jgi:hypothetical protein
MTEMSLHRARGDEQVLCDLLVGTSRRGQAGHLALGAGEGVRAGEGGAAGADTRRRELTEGVVARSAR